MVEPLVIRRATDGDRLAAAKVHVRSWQVGYRGIIFDEVLDRLDVNARATQYPFHLTDTGHPVTFIATVGGDVIGLVIVSPSREDDDPLVGEVQALYVDAGHWRSAVGSTLIEHAERQLSGDGFAEAFLWVLEDNTRGRKFYEFVGWRADGTRMNKVIGEREHIELRYRKELSD